MSHLLDTHAFLWFLGGDDQLSTTARTTIEDSATKKFVSIASIWEIAIKISLGKLTLGIPLSNLKEEIIKNSFEILPLDFDHLIGLSTLENHHKDPFDRVIIAQGISENLKVISKDPNFRLYSRIEVIW
ncbi:type II toxin-antitoxin system VapC family toxin [uncultured Imperialibacter sp.]|uniref:type II toxin-antitoxin system VapC family toxin n=1 Tax=uncultured Imperialibacter sp. TaxID=1672639 RepID=UPI0030DB3E51|tara:strand:+ start:5330 stop:5716 length:387 start_codon:yes stop_codon:yes gene_type:complete